MDGREEGPGYVKVADIEVTEVRPGRTEFVMQGRGSDGADYRLKMQIEMPVDPKTRAVLGEIFAQSDWKILRRVAEPILSRAARRRGAGSRS